MVGLALGVGLNSVAIRRGAGAPALPLPAVSTIHVAEGDSITAGASTHAGQWQTANPSLTRYNQAVGGSRIVAGGGASGLDERQALALSRGPGALTVLIGANDLLLYASATAFTDALAAYILPFVTAGWRVAVGTILPRGDNATHNARRPVANATIRSWIGSKVHTVYDFDRTIMGVEATTSNLTYFDADTLHPTAAGQTELYWLYKGTADWLFDIPRTVRPFSFNDASGVTASTVSTSNAITVSGLAYGETKAYSVSSGHQVRKTPWGGAAGSWVTDGSGTVENGDQLEVRATSSATAGATVNVVLNVGGVTDTYSIQTVNNLSPLTTTYRSTDKGEDLAFLASHTFSGITVYQGKAIIAINTSQGSVPTSVTLGGVAATFRASATSASITGKISFWDVPVSANGTGDLVIAATGGIRQIAYDMWSTDANAAFVDNKKAEYIVTDNFTPSITLPDGGSIVAAAQMNSTAALSSNSGTTERSEITCADWKFWAGDRASTGTVELTGIQFTGGHILAVSYQPS